MSPTPPSPPRGPKTFLYILGAVAALGYVCYSTFTNTGLGGWLMALQIQLFGSANEKLTVLVLAMGVLGVISAVAQRFDPVGFAAFMQPRPAGPAPTKQAQTKLLVIIAAVPVLLAVPAYFWLEHQAQVDEHRPVYSLDLVNNPAVPVPADAKFVHLSGVFQAAYQYILTETDNGVVTATNRYAPLTGVDWKPGEPVRFFLDTSTGYYYAPDASQQINLDQTSAFPGVFDGELSPEHLPTVVRQHFEQHQLRIAAEAYVLDLTGSYGNRPPTADSHSYYLILWFGGALSVVILLVGGLALAIRQARAR